MLNLRTLRDYQLRINQAVREFLLDPNCQRGQVYSPTGSGKTECFGHTVHELPEIIKGLDDKGLNIAIVHPRIALSQDQVVRFKDIFGEKYRYTSFHSGAHVKGTERYLEFSTTNVDELIEVIDQETRTHITFSSYDSFHKIAHIEFDLLILDEAHNLTQNQYLTSLKAIVAKKAIFYTATPINKEFEDEESAGMNQVELFGEVIARVEPKELILRGFVVPPLIQLLYSQTTQKGDDVDPVEIIAESFMQQKREMDRYRMPQHHMLVACRGSEDIRLINQDENLNKLWGLIKEHRVDVYTILAGECCKNGHVHLRNDRQAVLNEIKNNKNNVIVIHYDTLSEGIDISTLTGAVLLRKMSKAKIIQTIGRCGRPYIGDLDNNFVVRDMGNRMKPVCVITLPVIDGKRLGGNDAKDICEAFIAAGYDELTTYLDDVVKKTMSKLEDNPFEFDDESTDNVLSHILNSRVERKIDKLLELGFVF